jgi:hypothetical protein
MSTRNTQHTLSNEELARRWQARVATGTFSHNVIGVGEIRIMGRSGDAATTFPRILSLTVLSELEPDEQWAVRQAEVVVEQAQANRRAIFAVAPGTTDLTTPVPVRHFDPQAESLIVVARVAGG